MSLSKMISLHPDVGAGLNEEFAAAAKHAMDCSLFCTSCADACVAEGKDMVQCIRLCLDCADICGATARLATRRSGRNVEMLRAVVEACIRACELCEAECARHDHAHCRLCAQMCRECAEDCRRALPTIR